VTAEQAFAKQASDVFLTATGKIVQILTDDTEGDPHQRFILETKTGQTVLVCHNLERAYRIPICMGDKIEVHGAYVWNKHGGLVHNTHHDDRGIHEDGWINLVDKKKPQFA
jgi:hypothetical protein